jgi:hypothetical protein
MLDRHGRLWGLVGVACVVGGVVTANAAVLCKNKKTGALSISPGICSRKLVPVTLGNGLVVSDVGLSAGAQPAAGAVVLAGAGVATTTNTTPTKLDSFTVTVPGPGTLTVTVTGFFFIDAQAPGTTSITVVGDLGLCDDPDVNTTCGGTYTDLWYQDADNDSDVNTTPAFTLTRTVAVAAAGDRTFYVNGQAASPGQRIALWGTGPADPNAGPTATAVFTPTTLAVTRP